jgi:hypothetical protein
VLSSILLRIVPILALVGSALAQSPADLFSKAPPDVDEALRARMSKFYQAHVDGKPRRAEELVAEDSKDFFYESKKPKCLSFEIGKIEYSKDFTEAKAIVVVETYVPILGFGNKPMKVPVTSLWKIENGQWCWYTTEDVINTTPFGKLSKSAALDPKAPASSPDIRDAPSLETLRLQVKPDKLIVVLKAAEPSSDQVTIHNQMPGLVTLALGIPAIPGLEVKTDRTQVPAGESAVVSFHFSPGKYLPRGPVRVEVTVRPTNIVIPLQVSFK